MKKNGGQSFEGGYNIVLLYTPIMVNCHKRFLWKLHLFFFQTKH